MPLKRLTALYLGCCHQLTDGAARHIVRGLKVSNRFACATPRPLPGTLRPFRQDPSLAVSHGVFKWEWPFI